MSAHLDNLLSRLDRVTRGGTPGSWRARCPSHGGKGLTLAIKEGDDERVLLHCFAGCDVHEITAAVGLEVSDLFPPTTSSGKPSREGIPAGDALRCLDFEAHMVLRFAAVVADGTPLDDAQFDRLALAIERIATAMSAVWIDRRPQLFREDA